jgi:hypothetical protein
MGHKKGIFTFLPFRPVYICKINIDYRRSFDPSFAAIFCRYIAWWDTARSCPLCTLSLRLSINPTTAGYYNYHNVWSKRQCYPCQCPILVTHQLMKPLSDTTSITVVVTLTSMNCSMSKRQKCVLKWPLCIVNRVYWNQVLTRNSSSNIQRGGPMQRVECPPGSSEREEKPQFHYARETEVHSLHSRMNRSVPTHLHTSRYLLMYNGTHKLCFRSLPSALTIKLQIPTNYTYWKQEEMTSKTSTLEKGNIYKSASRLLSKFGCKILFVYFTALSGIDRVDSVEWYTI